jgi:hypothetical protein
MKSKTLPLMAALMGPVMMFTGMAGADPGKEDLTQVYEAGRRAFNKGDLAKAKIAFAKVLLAKPDFDLAQIYMAQIRHAEAQWAARPRSQKIAEQAIVRTVKLEAVSLADALEVTRREMEKAGGGAIALVMDLPADALDRTISLSVENLPMRHFIDAVAFAGDVRIAWHSKGLSVTANPTFPDKMELARATAVKAMQAAAQEQVITRLSFDNISVPEALQWLQLKADRPRGPLIVLRGPVRPARVTLDLRHVSLSDALRSVAIVADLEVSWHPWGAGLAAKSPVPVIAAPSATR